MVNRRQATKNVGKSSWFLSKFWELWCIVYMSLRRECVGWNHRQGNCKKERAPQKGEIVLVENEEAFRGCWPLGKIIDVHRRPNAISSVTIKMASGHEWRHPVSLVYPLELSRDAPELPEKEQNQSTALSVQECHEHGGRTKHNKIKNKMPDVPFLFLAVLVILQVQTSCEKLCTPSRNGVVLAIPNTSWETQSHSETEDFAQIVLYICTNAFWILELKVTQDRTEISGTHLLLA
ncbi:hypothetical protein Tcan_18484 [Toxocara canis]|uniref:DUF5641 domain-containing protein n=1 Tax=Toxocara canis TaxID=6265 RepID=A0A0B2V494_TOXCA|nr:hypothetical protein Tcan_18484 [Toxocara canis]